MKKYMIALLLGAVVGVIDVIPMVLQHLTWDANLSAFCLWVVTGLLISAVDFKMNGVVKGIFVAFLVLLPNAFLIGWHEPGTLLPIGVMMVILGGLLGFAISKMKDER